MTLTAHATVRSIFTPQTTMTPATSTAVTPTTSTDTTTSTIPQVKDTFIDTSTNLVTGVLNGFCIRILGMNISC